MKTGRNDPCPCGSGKKFKKCCEERMTRRKINAQMLSTPQSNKLTSFFQRKVEVAPPAVPTPAIDAAKVDAAQEVVSTTN